MCNQKKITRVHQDTRYSYISPFKAACFQRALCYYLYTRAVLILTQKHRFRQYCLKKKSEINHGATQTCIQHAFTWQGCFGVQEHKNQTCKMILAIPNRRH